MGGRRFSRLSVFFLLTLLFSAQRLLAASAAGVFGEASEQKQWYISPQDGRAVFLGSDAPATVTLLVQKAAFREHSVDITLETDAQAVALTSDQGTTSIRIAHQKGKSVLTLSADRARPSLKIDGREPPEFRGKWIAIALKEAEPKLSIQFIGATYCTVTFSGMAEPAPIRPAMGAPALPARSAEVALAATHPVALSSTRSSVFQLRVKDETGSSEGTAFLVAPDGYALTNFHVVQGAKSAEAVFDGHEGTFPVELYDVRPELDLALVRVKDLAPSPGFAPRPLMLANGSPAEGSDVWAVGFPMGLGFTVTKGVVNGVRNFSALPESIRSSMTDYSASSHWVQTDCAINPGNSGGPLLDEAGRVIGINTWIWLKGNNLFFALSADDARDFVKSPPKEAMTFAAANQRFKQTKVPWTIVPSRIPVIDVPQKSEPAQAVASAKAFLTGAVRICHACKGTGQEKYQVRVGTKGTGALSHPVYETRTRPCSRCGGHGGQINSPNVILRFANNAVLALATVKKTEADLRTRLPLVYSSLREACRYQPIRSVLIDTANGTLAQKKIDLQTPIMGLGILLGSGPVEEGGEPVYIVLLGETGHIVIISQPLLEDPALRGAAVMVGGLYAGEAETTGDRPLSVLQNGFIIKDEAGANVYDANGKE